MIALPETTTFAALVRGHFAEAAELARRESKPVTVSVSRDAPVSIDPVGFFAHGGLDTTYRVYWEQPVEGVVFVGLGSAHTIETSGESRFKDAAGQLRDALEDSVGDGSAVYLGGFSFAPDDPTTAQWIGFPAGLLVLPRLLLAVRAGETTITVNARIEPDTDPSVAAETALRDLAECRSDATVQANDFGVALLGESEVPVPDIFKASVAAAADDIRAGRLEKVVLARTFDLLAAEAFKPAAALRRLRSAGPAATVFAVAHKERCFLGATPERLVRLTGRDVAVDCLAGSIARGANALDDERLAQALLASAKDRHEHEVVVRAVSDALANVCETVERPTDTPKVVRSRNVQHLSTPLTGRLTGANRVLDLVERLHPTPAVGGYPRDQALDVIREREGIERGWYAGPIGWVNQAGEGEFVVALRSGLISGREATLYAGAGIMADSDPAAEYAETALKLKPMLSALGVR